MCVCCPVCRSLLKGSILGCTGIVLVVFFVGLCGILAAWGGQITATTDYNLYFFAVSSQATVLSPIQLGLG